MLPGKARTAENYPLRSRKVPIALRIVPAIAVHALPTGSAVVKAGVGAMDKLPAVGLEAVHAHIQQVPPLGKPALYRRRVGKIRHHRPSKPVALRNGIRAAVRQCHAQIPLGRVRPVQIILTVGELVLPLLLVHRHLPEEEPQPRLMEPFDHPPGVRPGRAGEVKVPLGQRLPIRHRRILGPIPDVEGGLIAPGLQHHHRGGKIVPLQLFQQRFHIFLAVPAVGGGPHTEHPLRRQHRRTEEAHIFPDHLLRRAGKQNDLRLFRQGHPDAVLLKGKHRGLAGVHIEAKAAVCPEKGGGTVGPVPLEAKLLPDLVDHGPPLLVQAVVFLPHAVSTPVGELDGELISLPAEPGGAKGQFFCPTGNSFHISLLTP